MQWGQRPAPPAMAMPFMAAIQQLSASINENVRQTFGIRLDRNEEFAWLDADTGRQAIATGATGSRIVATVGQEADFVATGIVAHTTTQADLLTATPFAFRYQIRDGSTNRELERNSLPSAFLPMATATAMSGARPFFLPKPRIFSRNSNVIWIIDNQQAADIFVDLAFFGYRIYDIDALDLTKAR